MASTNEVKHDSYEPAKLDVLLHIIKSAEANSQKQDYEIELDNFKVVPRTSNAELFSSFSDFITPQTKIVTVRMFRGAAKTADVYHFHIKGVPQTVQELNGMPENTTAEEWEKKQREKILKEIRFEQLEKENAKLTGELEDKEKTIEALQTRLEEVRQGKHQNFKDIGASLLEGAMESPFVKKNFPFLGRTNGLSGTPQQKTETPEEEGSFKRKEAVSETYPSDLSEEEQGYLILIRDLQERLNNHQFSSVMHILELLTQNPACIGSTLKHLHNFLNGQANSKKSEDEKV